MARTGDKLVAGLGSLLGLGRGIARPDSQGRPQTGRGCWPDPADLRKGDMPPAEAVRKAMRGRWL